MYLSLNFRFPTGSVERGHHPVSRDNGMLPTSPQDSAFKHPLPALPEVKNPEPLPPISSLRTEGQIPHPGAGRFPFNKPLLHSPQSAQQHHHHHAAAAMMNGMNHPQHPHPPPPPFPQPPTQQTTLASSFCPPPPNHTHPAFAFPLPSWLPAASHSVNTAQLQQMMSSDGGIMAQYLNGCDPLARAALMELSRMGHYPLGKKLFGCPQCRYITDRKNNLKRHVATMHQDCDKVLECCGIYFKNKASLRDHVLIFHSNGYMCRFCGRNFCRKALLKRHLTVHSGQKDFICDQCDYATSHKSNLERHRKVHERQGDLSDDNSSDTNHLSPTTKISNTLYSNKLNLLSPTLHPDKPMDINTLAKQLPKSIEHSIPQQHTLPRHVQQPDFSFGKDSIDRVTTNSSHSSYQQQQSNSEQKANSKVSLPSADDNCLIDLDDDFDLNNINVVDIDV